jgi:hypothetical protein
MMSALCRISRPFARVVGDDNAQDADRITRFREFVAVDQAA